MSVQAGAAFGGPLQLPEPKDVRTLDDGSALDLAGLTLRVDHAPGHTRGSVMFTTPTDEGVGVISRATCCSRARSGAVTCPGAIASS